MKRTFFLLFILLFTLRGAFAQFVKEDVVYASPTRMLTFYKDGTYIYSIEYENYDIPPTTRINPISSGTYIKSDRRTYRLYSDPQYDSSMIKISGRETYIADSSTHIIFLDSTKETSEEFDPIDLNMNEYSHHEYYYVVKLIYSSIALDSLVWVKHFEIFNTYPNPEDFDLRNSALRKEAADISDYFKSMDVEVVNGKCQQAVVCYGRECHFASSLFLLVDRIEVEIHSIWGSITCKYEIQDSKHNCFELDIPYFAYQCMFHKSYYGKAIKIINRNTIEMDSVLYKKSQIRMTEKRM